MFRILKRRRSTPIDRQARPEPAASNRLLLAQTDEEEDLRLMEWAQRREQLIDDLPWFGQSIPPPGSRYPRGPGRHWAPEDEERVLLSWLTGGSARRVATRAGVGRRTAYNVLRRLVYVPDPPRLMVRWFEAGLYTCMFSPRFPTVRQSGFQEMVCLICHTMIGDYERIVDTTEMSGETFAPEPYRHLAGVNRSRTACTIQGHLVLHFWLEDDPIEFGSRAWDALPQGTYSQVGALGGFRHSLTAPRGGGVALAGEWRLWRIAILERRNGSPSPAPPAGRSHTRGSGQ